MLLESADHAGIVVPHLLPHHKLKLSPQNLLPQPANTLTLQHQKIRRSLRMKYMLLILVLSAVFVPRTLAENKYSITSRKIEYTTSCAFYSTTYFAGSVDRLVFYNDGTCEMEWTGRDGSYSMKLSGTFDLIMFQSFRMNPGYVNKKHLGTVPDFLFRIHTE